MNEQTNQPLTRGNLNVADRQARWLIHQVETGDLDLNPPYQRGLVWTEHQQRQLIRSLLSGIPVQSVIINDRVGDWWTDTETYDRSAGTETHSYAVVDGKQRITALRRWFTGQLTIPATWLEPDLVADTESRPGHDGWYVRYTDLTVDGRRAVGNYLLLPVGEARVASVQQEAELYLLVNGGGTPQTSADMDAARAVAGAAPNAGEPVLQLDTSWADEGQELKCLICPWHVDLSDEPYPLLLDRINELGRLHTEWHARCVPA